MKYLLDTNTCVYLLNGDPSMEKKLAEVGVYSLALSNSVLAELYFGAYKSQKAAANIKRIELFKKNLVVLPDSEESARIFGKIKAELRSKGKAVDDFDILIASIALANDCTLIANDTDFGKIKGLRVENWREAKLR
ncbi:MAG: type II toxin-antitoxin system VapC family toxin [Nitrospinae bacterium]|nr:type II toxin-antitoxin system VapC family toxin [Nitrospinota bacterium]